MHSRRPYHIRENCTFESLAAIEWTMHFGCRLANPSDDEEMYDTFWVSITQSSDEEYFLDL
jgi:hypothetical protein